MKRNKYIDRNPHNGIWKTALWLFTLLLASLLFIALITVTLDLLLGLLFVYGAAVGGAAVFLFTLMTLRGIKRPLGFSLARQLSVLRNLFAGGRPGTSTVPARNVVHSVVYGPGILEIYRRLSKPLSAEGVDHVAS